MDVSGGSVSPVVPTPQPIRLSAGFKQFWSWYDCSHVYNCVAVVLCVFCLGVHWLFLNLCVYSSSNLETFQPFFPSKLILREYYFFHKFCYCLSLLGKLVLDIIFSVVVKETPNIPVYSIELILHHEKSSFFCNTNIKDCCVSLCKKLFSLCYFIRWIFT